MVAKKKSATKVASGSDDSVSSFNDDRVAEVQEITPGKEVIVIPKEGEAFRCHPDDIGTTLDQRDSAE